MNQTPLSALDTVQERVKLDARHRYLVYRADESRWVAYSGVTSVIGDVLAKPALVQWAANEQRSADLEVVYANYGLLDPKEYDSLGQYAKAFEQQAGRPGAFRRKAQAAADRGTTVHALAEAWIRKGLGLPYEVPEAGEVEKQMFRGVVSWLTDHKVEPLRTERRLVNDELRYAGTMDLLANVEGHPALVDFKTGKPVKGEPYLEWSLQSAAYRGALASCGFDDIRSYIVVLYRDGSGYEVHELERDHRPALESFASMLSIRRWMDERPTQLPGPADDFVEPEPQPKAPPRSSSEAKSRAKKATEKFASSEPLGPADPFRGFRA